jgi:hypothetical protein
LRYPCTWDWKTKTAKAYDKIDSNITTDAVPTVQLIKYTQIIVSRFPEYPLSEAFHFYKHETVGSIRKGNRAAVKGDAASRVSSPAATAIQQSTLTRDEIRLSCLCVA